MNCSEAGYGVGGCALVVIEVLHSVDFIIYNFVYKLISLFVVYLTFFAGRNVLYTVLSHYHIMY